MKKLLNHVFIDGLSGMTLGVFCTLIFGTILQQIGIFIGDDIGDLFFYVGKIASCLMGVGIGCGVAKKYEASPLVLLSAAIAGMVGAQANYILDGSILAKDSITLCAPGEPLGSFLAAFVCIEVGNLIVGKTQLDIVVTPMVCIGIGSITGILLCPPLNTMMNELGNAINWGTEQQPIIMGIVISVLMGMFLTLPISSAALCLILNLTGLAAGAATVGCCANMIGFAVASYKDNQMGGLLAQGIGTSMLQMPNILKRPHIWLPAIISSAVLGPISTCILHMKNTAVGAGMGTAGLVGPIMTYNTMAEKTGSTETIMMIAAMHFILPGLISFGVIEGMRKLNWVKEGDMKISV